MPAIAGPAIIGISTGFGVAGAVGATAAGIIGGVVAVGAYLLGRFIRPRARSQYDSELPQNNSSPVRPVQLVYGSALVAGNKLNSTPPGGDSREYVIGLSEGECQAIQAVTVDDLPADMMLGGTVTAFRSGDPDTAAPASGDFPLLHAKSVVQRFAHTATLWIKMNHKNYTRNGATITCYLEGLLCWDTALSARSFSRNPARIALTYLVDELGVAASRIDTTAFAALEAHCAEYGSEVAGRWSEDLTGAGTVTASSAKTGSSIQQVRGPSNVLTANGNNNFGVWATEAVAPPHWIQYDFGDEAGVRIGKFGVTPWRAFFPSTFAFQGSNDGSSWTTLGIKEDGAPAYEANVSPAWEDYTEKTFLVDPDDVSRYRYYRLYITASSSVDGQVDLTRWKMFALLGAVAPRHRCDIVIDTLRPVEDVKRMLGDSFRGRVIESQGKWKPVWLQNKSSVDFAFGTTNIVRDSLIEEDGESPNIVSVIFRNRARGGRQDKAEVRDDADIARRGEFPLEFQADWITDREIALREAQFLFDKERRYPGRLRLQSILAAARVEEFDVVTVEHPALVDGPKTFYVEDISADEYGIPTFELRAYGTDIFHDRLAPDTAPIYSEPSEIVESVQEPPQPDAPTTTRGIGSATITWAEVPNAIRYLVETRLVSADGGSDSGWRTPVEVYATTYTYTLTSSELSAYGDDAQIQFRVTAVSRWGIESEVSPSAAASIMPPDGGRMTALITADGTTGPFSIVVDGITRKAQPGTTELIASNRVWCEKNGASDADYDYELTESSPGGGYNQITLQRAFVNGEQMRLHFQPANNTVTA